MSTMMRDCGMVAFAFLSFAAAMRAPHSLSNGKFAPPSSAGSGDGTDGPWAQVSVGQIPDGCNSLGATIDPNGGITLSPHDPSVSGNFAAWATFRDTLDEYGWSGLRASTSEDAGLDDGVKMYAAGVVEGFLTADRMRQFYHNSRALLEMNSDNAQRTPNLKAAFGRMVKDLANEADDPATPSDPLANQRRLLLLQTWGIRDGYTLATTHSSSPALLQADAPALSMVDMFILNSDGVIDELEEAFGGSGEESILVQKTALRHGAKKRKRKPEVAEIHGHCTGLVRLAPDNKEVYFGHTTWEPFSEMTRIWKIYDMPQQGANTRKISFSSYPGCVSSTDDYYLMDNGLAITETTLNIPKKQHYRKDAKTPDFMRIMSANRLSTGAQDWAQRMSDSATSTYSSQWMVFDYNKFKQGEPVPSGTFYVLEQAPATNHMEDMSQWLNDKGYWASYDRAYFDDIRDSTGDNAAVSNEPAPNSFLYTKDQTPRAQIIRKTIGDVKDLASFSSEMSENKGTSEPVDQDKLKIPRFAVSARDDLRNAQELNPDGSPEGGVDSKVTSSCLFKSLIADTISGPSHSTDTPFKWTDNGQELWPGYPHEGLPDEANFDWVRVDPSSNELISPRGDGVGCA